MGNVKHQSFAGQVMLRLALTASFGVTLATAMFTPDEAPPQKSSGCMGQVRGHITVRQPADAVRMSDREHQEYMAACVPGAARDAAKFMNRKQDPRYRQNYREYA